MSVSPSELIDRIRPPLAALYDIERLLAVGGMAYVYVARDLKHDRKVALKVLSPELGPSVGASRFVREIRFAARLTHPHILPVLDSGETAGLPFYVMPFVEGESLRDRLDRERTIDLDAALRIAKEIADALAYAHAAGIVHRDIKPENILLFDGHALIADFGIARAISAATDGSTVTGVGIAVGTPAYMSPEQASGDDNVDGRSDVYSLATVFFEMLSGVTPFADRSPINMITKRLTQAAPRLDTRRPDLPREMVDAVAIGLSILPSGRPATISAFSNSLSGGARHPTVTGPTPRAIASQSFISRQITAGDSTLPSVAVLPFSNLSSDPENEFFSDGITEEIIGALTKRRTLRVAARTSSFAFKGKVQDIRGIAEQLGVSTILDGSVRRAGSRVRVRAQLTDAQSGFEIWTDQLDRELDDVFAIQDEIADSIANALQATLLGGSIQVSGESLSGEVYEEYLRGRHALNQRTESELHRAVQFFTRATDREPDFALAFAGLADALLILGIYGAERPNDVMPLAREAAQRALSLDPSLAEAYATLGAVRAVYDWDWRRAEDAFQRAIALGPRSPNAYQRYSMNCLVALGRFDEAKRAVDRARYLDPLSLVMRASAGVIRLLAGEPGPAVTELDRALELDEQFSMAHYFKGAALRELGRYGESMVSYETAIAQAGAGGGTPEMIAGLAQTLASSGHRDGALMLRDRLLELSNERHVSPCVIAQVEVALGNPAAAIAQLDRAVA
ncbi:MAG TPA: protein kinase, partial [Gemmatimonadaceae bacterium]|nr:protein kinase [Gemmatimonadaceae bacterium]